MEMQSSRKTAPPSPRLCGRTVDVSQTETFAYAGRTDVLDPPLPRVLWQIK